MRIARLLASIRADTRALWAKKPDWPFGALSVIALVATAVASIVNGFGNAQTKLEFLTVSLPCLAAVIGGAGILVKDAPRKPRPELPGPAPTPTGRDAIDARDQFSAIAFWWSVGLLLISIALYVRLKVDQGGQFSFEVSGLVLLLLAFIFGIILITVVLVYLQVTKNYDVTTWWEAMLSALIFVAIPLLAFGAILKPLW